MTDFKKRLDMTTRTAFNGAFLLDFFFFAFLSLKWTGSFPDIITQCSSYPYVSLSLTVLPQSL
jgi:hypothetical protein